MSISAEEMSTTIAMPSDMDPAPESFLLYQVADWLALYGTPVVLLLGTFGNVMTIAIMRRMTSSSESTVNVYFTSLAVMDLVVLLSLVVAMYTKDMHVLSCVLGYWGYNAGTVISAWILVCLTLHRAVSVAWPHKVGLVLTQRRVVIIIAIITLVFFLLTSVFLFMMDVIEAPWTVVNDNEEEEEKESANESMLNATSDSSSNVNEPEAMQVCMYKAQYKEFFSAYTYAYMAVYSLFPFLCLIVGNVVLIWKLIASVKDTAMTLTSDNTEQADARRKVTTSVTLTVVIVSTAFIVLTLPFCVKWAVFSFQLVDHEFSGLEYAQVYFVDALSTLLANLNHAINFYLYCLPGRRFRQEFLNIVCSSRTKSRPGQQHSTSSGGLKTDNFEKLSQQTEVTTHEI